MTTWQDIVEAAASRAPGQPVFTHQSDGDEPPTELTYAQLHTRAGAIAADLVDRGLSGERAVLLYPFGLEYVEAFFGCLYAGVVAVPTYPPSRHQSSVIRFTRLVKDSGAKVALTTDALRERLARRRDLPVMASLPMVTPDPSIQASDSRTSRPGGDDLAFLQYTSGSTGQPKGVMLTHANLLANTALIRQAFGLSEQTRGVSWLPLYHDMGMIGSVLGTVFSGGSTLLMPPSSFARDPGRWLRAVSDFGATVSGGPDFAYNLCVERIPAEQRAALDLSRWQVAYSGAEPIRERTLRSFAAAFADAAFSPQAFLPCYGLAESALLVTAGERGSGFRTATAPESGHEVVGSGRAPAGVDLRVANAETGAELLDGAEGEVHVKGASVARGYWNRPELSAEVFRDGWLRTGDLGFVRDGELFLTGRSKDLVIVRGRNHHPQDIEATVEGADSRLRPHGCAAFAVPGADGEELAVACELRREAGRRDLDEIARRIGTAIAGSHAVRPQHVVLVPFASLPRTSSGKIARHACQRGFLDEELPVWHAANATGHGSGSAKEPEETSGGDLERLRTEIAGLLGVATDEVSVDTPLVELGLDSLDAVTVVHRVGQRAGVDIATEALLHRSVRELLAEGAPADERPVQPTEPGDYPLSAQQRGIRYSYDMAPESTAYLVGAAIDVYGECDPHALRTALADTVDRHPALRTTFPLVGGAPTQRVHLRLAPGFDIENLSPDLLEERTSAVASTPLDVVTGPVVRLTVFRTGTDRHRLLLSLHHLVADLWSIDLVLREVCQRYVGAAAWTGTPVGFPALVAREREVLAGPEAERLAEYWRSALSEPPGDLDLHTGRTRPPVPRMRGASTAVNLTSGTTARLRRLARSHGTTLYNVLLTAYSVTLWKYSRQSDLLVGTPVHGRSGVRSGEVVGCCVNTVPVRCRVDPESSFVRLLERTSAASGGAISHAAMPFVELVDLVGARREASRPPLVQVMFALQRAADGGDLPIAAMAVNQPGVPGRFGPALCESVALPRTGAMVDLAMNMAEVGDRLAGELVYDTDLFEQETAERLARQFASLLDEICDRSDEPVRQFAPVEPTLLNGEDLAYLVEDHVHLRVARQAARRPEAVAVTTDDETLTYRQLEQASDALARLLVARGVRPGDLIGIRLPRRVEFVVSMLAALKAGAAYLPVSPELPEGRFTYLIEDSHPRLLISRSDLTRPELPCQVLELDRATEELNDQPVGAPEVPTHPESLAYVLYTSGSTGRPKGVGVPHRALNNFLAAMARVVPMDSGSRLLAPSSFSFDISVFDIYLPLVSGGTCYLAGDDTVRDGHELRTRLDSGTFTHMQATPVTWQLLVDAGWRPAPDLTLITGGEALPRELAAHLSTVGKRVVHMYGPTETTVWSTSDQLSLADSTGSPPIGVPVANTGTYVLDEHLTPLPAGAAGELYIGGDGLTTGYLGRPGLTASRFLPDPFRDAPGGRMYATGDLVRVRNDGRLEFLGRIDSQVKLNGRRIELEEIEALLDRNPAVTRSVVDVYRGTASPLLVAYLTGDATVPDQEILNGLRAELPGYMVPGRVVWLTSLPVNSSGKVDRRALPAPPAEVVTSSSDGQEMSAEERRLESVVAELLGLTSIGRSVDFFSVGGHSLMMARLATRIEEMSGARLSLRQIMENPTVAGLASQIAAVRKEGRTRQRPAAGPIRAVDRSRYVVGRGPNRNG